MLYIFARLHHARETEPQLQEEAFIIKTSRIKPALRTRGSAAGFRRARGWGRGRGEGTASALPQFPWVRTEKRGVITGVFWGWIACGVLCGGGIPCGSGHPMDHAALGTREKANLSSSHLAGRPRGAEGGGWVGGWVGGWLDPSDAQLHSQLHWETAPELHVCQNPASGSPPRTRTGPRGQSDFEPADIPLDWILPEVKLLPS